MLLAALIIHGLRPGPLLYSTSPEIVNAIMATHLMAHVLMFVLMTAGCLLFARLMLIPRAFLFPVVIVFCVLGAFAPDSQMWMSGSCSPSVPSASPWNMRAFPWRPSSSASCWRPWPRAKLRSA